MMQNRPWFFLAGCCGLLAAFAAGEEAVQLRPLVVVSSAEERSSLEEPSVEPIGLEIARGVVSLEDIGRQRPLTLTEALEFASGSLTETRGRKVKQFTSFRGQTYPYPDYAVDGLWFREFVELPYFFPASEIDRIEVCRSAAALVVGLSGVAGIINVIPRTYSARHTYVEAEIGQDATRFAHLAHHEPLGRGMAGVSLSRYSTDSHEAYGEEELWAGAIRVDQSITEALTLDVNLFLWEGEREFVQAREPAATRYRLWEERYDPHRAVLGSLRLVYEPEEGRATELSLWGADRHSAYKRYDPLNDRRVEHDDDDVEYGVQALQALKLNARNILRFGGLYHRWVSPDGKRFYAGRRTDVHTVSAVVVDEQEFDRLTLDAGLRVSRDYIDEYGAFSIEGSGSAFRTVEPVKDEWDEPVYRVNAGGRYTVNEHVALYGNYAFAHAEPRSGSLTRDLSSPDTEHRHTLDAGVKTKVSWLSSLSAGGFAVIRRDAVVLTGETYSDAAGLEYEYYGNQDVVQYGLEAGCRTRQLPGGIALFADVLLMDSRIEDEDGETRDYAEVPDEVVTAGAYLSAGAFDLNVFGKYVGRYENDRFSADGQPQPLGDYVDINLVAGITFGEEERTRLYAKLENLLDDEYSTVVGYYDAGRRASVGLQHVF